MKSVNMELTPYKIKEILIETSQSIDLISDKCKSGGCIDTYEALKQCE